MSCKRKDLLALWVVIVAALVLTEPTSAVAQRTRVHGGVTGGARLRPGPGTWANQRTSRRVQHARDYSRDIYRYSRDAQHIEPAVVKSESEELGRNITEAQRELAAARQELGDDSATMAALKSIGDHLAAAGKHHKMLHEECHKPSVNRTACMKHCNTVILELDKAQAEHDALMRSRAIRTKTEE